MATSAAERLRRTRAGGNSGIALGCFGHYVRNELLHWGKVYTLHRQCHYLGYVPQSLLAVLIAHDGVVPGPERGYRTLKSDGRARRIELIVDAINARQPSVACALRGMYGGRGRVLIERWETTNLLLSYLGHGPVTQQRYLSLHALGVAAVAWRLCMSIPDD